MKKAIVLLSGGLDSATTLYIAKKQGYRCFCLVFDYGQRQRKEINAAKKIARAADSKLQIIKISLPWNGSSLLDKEIKIPRHHKVETRQGVNSIPSTYVAARNIIFLSFALSYAEIVKAVAIFIGAHIQDYSGYPDCRPEFYRAFQEVISKGTKSGAEKRRIDIKTPLIKEKKSEIIRQALELGVPLYLTCSCYNGTKVPCGVCDSCYYRRKGFSELGIEDPALEN
ncbi:7-cyano-7-deazaguanine synthase QueC [bacterium]|nr:MAG: 7-cyano-7-deazaguanine synthase QueC [bacterium]